MTTEELQSRGRAGRGSGENRWADQLERLAQDAPAELAASLRCRRDAVRDAATLRAELGALGYDDKAIDRATRRARGGLRRPRFVRTAALALVAAALAAAQQVTELEEKAKFTWHAWEAIEGKFERYVRGSRDRGVHRATAGSVWTALARHADVHGFCWPGIDLIAREGHVSRRSVQRVIEIFDELGLLLVIPRDMERGSFVADRNGKLVREPRSHAYWMLPEGLDDCATESAPAVAPPDPVAPPPLPPPAPAPAVATPPAAPAPRPAAAPWAVRGAIAPVEDAPEPWRDALAPVLGTLRDRLGVSVPAWRIYEMAVEAERDLPTTLVQVRAAAQRKMNEAAAGKKPTELDVLENVRLFLGTARTAPPAGDPPAAGEPAADPLKDAARQDADAARRRDAEIARLKALADEDEQLKRRRAAAAALVAQERGPPDQRG